MKSTDQNMCVDLEAKGLATQGRDISIYFTGDSILSEEYKASIIKLASILGKGEPITQIEIDNFSILVPQESPKKFDNRFWARKQANKQLRKFK